MAKEGRRHKNRRQSVSIAADSGSTKHPTSKSSRPSGSGADDPGKNSTSNPNIESLEWVTWKQEERLDKFIRKKLHHLYGLALSTLVYRGFDQDFALKGLLERGYCVGEADCLTNLVQHSLRFLIGKDIESEEDCPQPFQNLELLVDFNLHFLVYVLQKYSPNLNRMSILRCILMADLNLNRALIMNINHTSLDITQMLLSDLNLDEDEKDEFLALEIREMLNSLNVLDDSVSEDMKDAMIAALQKPMDDLKPQLEKRMRWASKKLAQARRNQPNMMIMSLREELWVFEYSLNIMLVNRMSKLLSAKNEIGNVEETINRLEMAKVEIKAEISASELIVSETRQKCLEVSKKGGQLKNWEKQKVKLQVEIELEKEKISKWEQQLVENEAAIKQGVVKLCAAIHARKTVTELIYLENQLAIEKYDSWRREVDAMKIQTNGKSNVILRELMHRLKKLVAHAVSFVTYEFKL